MVWIMKMNMAFQIDAHRFLEIIKITDGIILSLAEHNGAYSAVFKNFLIGCLELMVNYGVEKPMLLMATSPGGRGGVSVLEIAKGRFPFHDGNIVAEFFASFFR